jgi:hypothetical protein
MNLQENIQRIREMMGAIKELSETTDDVVGKEFWFEYHCFESPKSCDAELWYRTHNKVLVLSIVELGCGDTKLERLLEGCPRVYRVVFEDGFEYDVFEDELMESKEEFERPDAPKRNQQEQISRIQSMMGVINEEQRKPSEEEFNQAMEDVKTIIPLISHRIIDEEELEHNEETMVKLNKMIRQKVKEGNDEVLDEMWELAGSRIIKNAINIITYYTK